MKIFNAIKSKLYLNKAKKKEGKIQIYVNEDITNGKLEGYNRLRDNILFANSDGSTRVIQLESSVAHEGKTTISCNLAVSLGLADKKVIIVDLDFRKPKVNRAFGLSNELGIYDFMIKDAKKEDIIKRTTYKNVDVITRGDKIYNSTVILLSEKFKDLIKELKNEYDYVILDCAPVLLVSDHIHISQVSDGILFVVAYAQTAKSQVTDAIQIIKRNNTRIIGTVFSMYDKKKDKNYNHYYGGLYYQNGYYEDKDDSCNKGK